MNDNLSDLRQYLDVLGAQIELGGKPIDRAVILQTLRNIAFAAADKTKAIPTDVFAPGISDTLMRTALAAMCLSLTQAMIQQRVTNQKPK